MDDSPQELWHCWGWADKLNSGAITDHNSDLFVFCNKNIFKKCFMRIHKDAPLNNPTFKKYIIMLHTTAVNLWKYLLFRSFNNMHKSNCFYFVHHRFKEEESLIKCGTCSNKNRTRKIISTNFYSALSDDGRQRITQQQRLSRVHMFHTLM